MYPMSSSDGEFRDSTKGDSRYVMSLTDFSSVERLVPWSHSITVAIRGPTCSAWLQEAIKKLRNSHFSKVRRVKTTSDTASASDSLLPIVLQRPVSIMTYELY